ncbi:unnamed protein product [Adineta ricciae]|uniref:Sulfotransferase n=1 Tax=Adineta ricciae TaxID=249248 RepID=A0A815PWL3_ADIRI|nr:unnamed protein product [Adineta ricciae]CAF1455345.1 unnamed protein product [Adineta ricciae]
MTEKFIQTAKEEISLLDDITLNENDLTEEAKALFTYHTDILNAFEGYRLRILQDKNLSSRSRHRLFSMLNINHINSKQVLNYMAENKELISRNLPLIGPVVICGLPRSGSTLLYNLLACDPHCHAPLYTDMRIEPTPPVSLTNHTEHERRKALLRPFLTLYTDKVNGTKDNFVSSHPMFNVEEDYAILYHAGFMVVQMAMLVNNQSKFSDFLSSEMKKDFIYNYHELFLRMLNSVNEPSSHWLLKAPVHSFYLDTLLQHYPNAALIMTHRYMKEVLPSFCRMMVNFEKVFSIEPNSTDARDALIAQYTQLIDKMVECLLEFRSTHPERNVFDVKYNDLMKQPIDTVHRIYDHFGLKWSNEFEIAMQSWLQDNPQGKQGRHSYSLDDFGFKQEDIDVRYANYDDLFLRSSSSGTTQ